MHDFNIPCPLSTKKRAKNKVAHLLCQYSQKHIKAISFDNEKFQVQQLTRITLVTDTLLTNCDLRSTYASFDIVAITTSNPDVFEQACRTLTVDLIAIDCSQRLPFALDISLINIAMERGIYFEMCYGPAIRDGTARGYLIEIAKHLVAATHGKKTLLNSGAESITEIRTAEDLYHFAKFMGLPNDAAHHMSRKNSEEFLHIIQYKHPQL
ncbi:RNase P subunit p30-domain-containing protein [Spinellus fusiger]|nr:RNase P subunit p30-domain-containing protein [Spinellus fusiger]